MSPELEAVLGGLAIMVVTPGLLIFLAWLEYREEKKRGRR